MGPAGKTIAAGLYIGSEVQCVRYGHLQQRKDVQHLGSLSGFSQSPQRRMKRMVHGAEEKEKWMGWRPQDDEQEEKFKRMVIQKGDEESVKSLATIQNILSPRPRRSRILHKVTGITTRTGCRRRLLWEKVRQPGVQGRLEEGFHEMRQKKARAEHQVRCSLMPREKKTSKPLKKFFIDGEFSENREDWKKELQKHCEAVCVDSEDTDEKQRERIQRYEKLGKEQRIAEISVDLVLHARARFCDDQVDGPRDKVVSEMLKRLPLAKVYEVAERFQKRFMERAEVPNSWEPEKRIKSFRAIALTAVMSKWYATCVILRMEEEMGPED